MASSVYDREYADYLNHVLSPVQALGGAALAHRRHVGEPLGAFPPCG
jgi:hypothetical protein